MKLRLILLLYASRMVSAQPEPDYEDFENDLTPQTFFDLSNGSKEYKPFNLTEFENISRKQMSRVSFNTMNLKHVGNEGHIARACYYISTTYKAALTDIRKYFPLRYLYVQNLEYEVGYLTHEIVSRYQNIVELYHLVQKKFEKHPQRHYATASYMLYIYTNILEQCKVIFHLCNMMHELPLKFKTKKRDKGKQKSIFEDYHVEVFFNQPYQEGKNNYEEYLKRIEKEKRNKRKERNKLRKQNLAMGLLKIPIVQRQPNQSLWPLNYGWSIEDGWRNDME